MVAYIAIGLWLNRFKWNSLMSTTPWHVLNLIGVKTIHNLIMVSGYLQFLNDDGSYYQDLSYKYHYISSAFI